MHLSSSLITVYFWRCDCCDYASDCVSVFYRLYINRSVTWPLYASLATAEKKVPAAGNTIKGCDKDIWSKDILLSSSLQTASLSCHIKGSNNYRFWWLFRFKNKNTEITSTVSLFSSENLSNHWTANYTVSNSRSSSLDKVVIKLLYFPDNSNLHLYLWWKLCKFIKYSNCSLMPYDCLNKELSQSCSFLQCRCSAFLLKK